MHVDIDLESWESELYKAGSTYTKRWCSAVREMASRRLLAYAFGDTLESAEKEALRRFQVATQ